MSKKLFKLSSYEGLYNCRIKYYPDKSGEFKPVEIMATDRFIFNPDGLESDFKVEGSHKVSTSEADKIARAKARAKSKVFDLIMCNKFDYFVTLTLSPEEINREDYAVIINKLNGYLANRVRRNGLYYVGVAELHKKGGFHFHFLVNDTLRLIDSGTVLRPAGGRPVKQATAIRQGYSIDDLKTVYNIADWSLGFSTAIRLFGDKKAVANYVGKYITKGEKVGGRWYYSGGDLTRPRYEYKRIEIEGFNPDYTFSCPNGEFKVKLIGGD